MIEILFPGKVENYKKRIKELEKKVEFLEGTQRKIKVPTIDDLMRDSLGLPMIHFHNVDEEGKPPHYLSGLNDDLRKQYIAELNAIYINEKFQEVLNYTINLLGNHSIQKATDENMRNGRIAIVGIRTLLKEFKDAHAEYVDSMKGKDDFDPMSPLPE